MTGKAAEIAKLAAHPDMPHAMRVIATGALELYRHRPLLNLVLNDRVRIAVSHIALDLHYNADPSDPGSGLTTNRFKQVFIQAGLGSRGRAAAILALLRFAGMLVPVAATNRGQRQRLLPTEAFFALQRDRLRLGFSALAVVAPEGAIGLARLNHQDFGSAITGEIAKAVRSSDRPISYAPKMAYFLERNAGFMVVAALLLAGGPDDTVPPAGPIWLSAAALARRSAVSRAHVARILSGAEEEGFLQRAGTEGNLYQLTPLFRQTATTFIAALLHLLAQSVVAATTPRDVLGYQAA